MERTSKVEVTTTHLEILDPADLSPARATALEVRLAEIPSPELNRFLYTAVGGDWYWLDRLEWNYGQWLEWLDRPELYTWIAWDRGTPAGYFELEQQGRSVEIAYFGLLPAFAGRGHGGHLLTRALEEGFALAERVWVHTCTLDGPHALANYRKRGMVTFKVETRKETLPLVPPGPWPGAR